MTLVCFSETHLDEDDTIYSNSLHPEDFDISLGKNRTRNDGGIMIYVSSLLNYKGRIDLDRLAIVQTV